MERNRVRISQVRVPTRLPVIAFGLLVALSSTALGEDHIKPCSNATLKGSYGYYKTGPIVDGGGQVAEVGIFFYDGNGGTVGRATRNENGEVTTAAGSAFYAVYADCTGSLLNDDGGEYAFLVVMNDGATIYILSENNPICVVATKIRAD